MDLLHEIAENLISGKAVKVKELVQQAINENIPPAKILHDGMIAGMNVVGVKFKANEFYIPEVLIAARAMHAGMSILKPLLSRAEIKSPGKILIGTVKGDLHDIGKNLVAMMLEGAGFEIIDLGVDVPPEKFVQAAVEKKPDLIGMSALLTTTMTAMKTTIAALKSTALNVKTMVGGAPLTELYAREIGADGYAADAATAVDKAKELITLK